MEKLTVGKFIACLRKSALLTQSALAGKLGVSAKTVSKWECDEGLPDIGTLPSLAKELGITIEELLQGERNADHEKSAQSDSISAEAPNVVRAESGEDAGKEKQPDCRAIKCESRFKALILVSIGLCLLAAALIFFSFQIYDDKPVNALTIVAITLALCAAVLFTVNIVNVLTTVKGLPEHGKALKNVVFGWTYSLFTALALSVTAAALKYAAELKVFTTAIPVDGSTAAPNFVYEVKVWQLFLIMYAVSFVVFNLRYVLRRLLVKQGVISAPALSKPLKFNLVFAAVTLAANAIIWFICCMVKSADFAFAYLPLWLTVFQALYAAVRAVLENRQTSAEKLS